MTVSAWTATLRMVGKIHDIEFIFGKEIQTFSLHFEDFLVSRDRAVRLWRASPQKITIFLSGIVKGTIQLFPKIKMKVPFMTIWSSGTIASLWNKWLMMWISVLEVCSTSFVSFQRASTFSRSLTLIQPCTSWKYWQNIMNFKLWPTYIVAELKDILTINGTRTNALTH